MEIRNKPHPDPVTEVPQVEAYMRYALMAAEEMLGRQKLAMILRENRLERLIDHYPSDALKLTRDITHHDYSNLCTSLMRLYGSDGKKQLIRFGRISTKPALDKQGKIFNFAAKTAIRFLPLSAQIKTVLDSIKGDLDKVYQQIGNDVNISIEDRGDKWAYLDKTCAECAGKESDVPICWCWVGTLAESLTWMTGKEFDIDQVECRAMGAQACVWEINKIPKN